MMGDRADRLSSRRKNRASQSDGGNDSDETDNTDNTVKTDNTGGGDDIDGADEESESLQLSHVTKEQMMHLPESQHKRLHHLYNRMKADYEYEFDDDYEMNRHYFPLVLQYGLDQFEDRSVEEIRQDLSDFSEGSE
jgi:hypothetical protein